MFPPASPVGKTYCIGIKMLTVDINSPSTIAIGQKRVFVMPTIDNKLMSHIDIKVFFFNQPFFNQHFFPHQSFLPVVIF